MKCPITEKECSNPEKQILYHGKWCPKCEHNKENLATIINQRNMPKLTDIEGFWK